MGSRIVLLFIASTIRLALQNQASRGCSSRSWQYWCKHVLVPLEAKFRLDKKVRTWFNYKGGTEVWLDKGSFVAVQKYVASQKTQFSKACKKENKGTGSAAEPGPKSTSALHKARGRIWGNNPACYYLDET